MKKNSSFLALAPLVAIAGVVALFQNKTFLFILLALVALIVVVVAVFVARGRRAASTVSAVPSASSTTIPVVSYNYCTLLLPRAREYGDSRRLC